MKKISTLPLYVFFLASACSFAQTSPVRNVGDGCEDCELMLEGMPPSISSTASLAEPGEKGERMIIRGTVFQKDGKTPASDVVVYIYHTDITGRYTPAPGQPNGRRHGHLRGWFRTGKDGRYEIKTIRPASYPEGRNPQHIHAIVKEPNTNPYWIDEYLFEGDPYLDSSNRASQQKRGGAGIVTLTKNKNGVWEGKRDLILGLNIPNY